MNMKVMTFNLRVDTDKDGINNFPNRAPRVLEAIRTEQPDLIGFQEATESIRTYLKQQLSATYTVVGCGRNARYRGESCCIAYRTDRFELIALDTHSLSPTPQIPGSVYAGSDQSSCPRMYVHATLSCDGVRPLIHFFNTHLDHVGAQARALEMAQILQHMSVTEGYHILTGDMNDEPTSPCIRMATAMQTPMLRDATASIARTFHQYGANPPDCVKIDYIFTDGNVTDAYALADEGVSGVYISDHYPVCARLELAEE